MVLYFTGTGNSRYLAEALATHLHDTVVDAAQLIKTGEHPLFESAKPYIFVSPVYAWRLPRVFETWIKACRFEGNKKAYFILSCGSEIGAAGDYVQKFASKTGFAYMGTAGIVMPENYLVMFTPPPQEEDAGTIAKAEARLADLCTPISEEVPFDQVKITFVGRLCSGIVNSCFYTFYIGARKFHTTNACISCGKCVQNCMLNNIMLKDGKPVWGKECTHCMACICKCPTEAIEYGKHTKGLRRYVCPNLERQNEIDP